jgi:hypothetical protein
VASGGFTKALQVQLTTLCHGDYLHITPTEKKGGGGTTVTAQAFSSTRCAEILRVTQEGYEKKKKGVTMNKLGIARQGTGNFLCYRAVCMDFVVFEIKRGRHRSYA